jgi:hypothetical protein
MRHGRDPGESVAPRLHTPPLEAVDVKVLALVLIAVAMLAFAGGTRDTQPPVTGSRSPAPVVATSRDAPSPEPLDAYGNEITNAVAEYSLDPAGSLYELHTPQIELPHLGSPKS